MREINGVKIKPVTPENREKVVEILNREWGAPIVSRGKAHALEELPGFIAVSQSGEISGLITYNINDFDCEITSLNSFDENKGIGSALINEVMTVAKNSDCKRLWLVTTNDITYAIRFYQKRGFEWVATHINSAEILRRLKPAMPLIGEDGIPIKHEIEFEIRL